MGPASSVGGQSSALLRRVGKHCGQAVGLRERQPPVSCLYPRPGAWEDPLPPGLLTSLLGANQLCRGIGAAAVEGNGTHLSSAVFPHINRKF